ncbi:MAG TPA: hypothetical protein VHA54_12690 [Solirubrobacterales bacterium]|nr:hypothetical protein [Solirubrobacterales bacterium]
MSKRFIALLAGVVAIVAIVAGCGSSDDSSSLSKAEFIKQGDEICKSSSKQIEAEAEEFAEDNNVDTSNPTKKQQEEVIEEVVAPGLRSEADELEALGTPKEDGDKAEAVLAALDSGVSEIEGEAAAVLSNDNPLEKASKLAREFGFKSCGQE